MKPKLKKGIVLYNKDEYDAIKKTRTIENKDYTCTLGIGANKSARIEFVDTDTSTVISSMEVRSDGSIYNGVTGNKLFEEKTSVVFNSWHSVIPMRSDDNYLYLMLYGTNHLKEGNYSIANDFSLFCYSISDSNVNGTITIPVSAIEINRREWGFELIIDRTKVTNIKSGLYDGIAIVSNMGLTIKST